MLHSIGHLKISRPIPDTVKLLNMKICIVICLFAFVVAALGLPGEKYTDKYDNLNITEIVTNERLLNSYFKCIMDQGKCTVEGTTLKPLIQDALETKCAKCTEVQKGQTSYMIKFLINNKPDYWNQLTAKYDPSKKYTTKYEKELREIKA